MRHTKNNITRTFDRHPRWDVRNERYLMRDVVAGKAPRTRRWRCDIYNDQHAEGACVGFGWGHELNATPKPVYIDETGSLIIYNRAKELDPWAGVDYEGTTVLAGAKTVLEMGKMGSYRWATSLSDIVLALGYHGPVVVGTNWYDGMWDTDSDGFLHVTGEVVGGHCTLLRAVNIEGGFVVIHNSWGRYWGTDGTARLSLDDLQLLIEDDAEFCVPMQRRL